MGWNPNADHCQADYDNHANQLNPNNDEYEHCREQQSSTFKTKKTWQNQNQDLIRTTRQQFRDILLEKEEAM